MGLLRSVVEQKLNGRDWQAGAAVQPVEIARAKALRWNVSELEEYSGGQSV